MDTTSERGAPSSSPSTSCSTPKKRGQISTSLGWVDPPAQLDLLQVIYVLRHGDRTPVRKRLTTAQPPLPSTWNMCYATQRFDQSLHNHIDGWPGLRRIPPRLQAPDEMPGPSVPPQAKTPGDCLLGQLTDQGRMAMLQIGQAIRARYIEKEHLLSPRFASRHTKELYLRSTYMSRTIESLEEVVKGLVDGGPAPDIVVYSPKDEDMLPNARTCPRLGMLMRKFADRAVKMYNPLLAQYDEAVKPMDCGNVPRLCDGPKLSGLVDTMRSARAHGLPLPKQLENPELLKLMEHAVLDEWFGGYASSNPGERRQYRRMALAPFFEEIYSTFAQRVTRGSEYPRRMSVYLGHDATLVGVLHVLDVFNHRWPAFSSGVGLELFHDRTDTQLPTPEQAPGYYVRCRYGDEELRLPGCQAPGKHFKGRPELCTLDAFREIVVDRLRHPEGLTIQQECHMT